VTAGLHHYIPAITNAAQIIADRMKPFGKMYDKTYGGSSAAVKALVYSFEHSLFEEMNLLALSGWVNELKEAEAIFTQIFLLRTAELSTRPKIKFKKIRSETEASYRQIIKLINADLTTHGESICGPFAHKLNKLIKYTNEHSHRRARKGIEYVNVTTLVDQLFTGKVVMPVPQLFFIEEGKMAIELIFSVDFTVTYRNNINRGTAVMIVHGKGAYRGTKTIPFNIV